MRFRCEIEMDNAAFADDPDRELARCLEGVARQVGCLGTFRQEGPAMDANGNTVGRWTIEGEAS